MTLMICLEHYFIQVENPLNKEIDWKPEIDIKESDNLFQIKADIPGLTKKDIKISVRETN